MSPPRSAGANASTDTDPVALADRLFLGSDAGNDAYADAMEAACDAVLT